jgi:molybdopterin-guanine dinucleotide biosynthesis protein A
MPKTSVPIGVILAGGLGARIGGAKAIVELRGRPLITYPCTAVSQALRTVVILAKADTELPSIPGVTVWIEPATPRHPLVGIIHALGLSEGRPILVCPVDLPFVTPEVIRGLAEADPGTAPAVVATAAGTIQPLLGCFQPETVAALEASGFSPDAPARQAVTAIGAKLQEVDPLTLFNINSPDDLLQAAAMLDRSKPGYPNVKS